MYFCLFDSALGWCALAWNDIGITGVSLPERNVSALRQRMQQRFPDASEFKPPRHIRAVVADVVRLLQGKRVDLSAVALDMSSIPAFHRRVYDAVSKLPAGKTLSYGEVAKQLGKPNAARAVGQAMARNPFPILVPCHRVLAAHGKLGGFSSYFGTSIKQRMLTIEKAMDVSMATAAVANPRAVRQRNRAIVEAAAFSSRKALAHLRKADALLGEWIAEAGAYRLQVNGVQSVFLALAEAIVYQQLHGKAAATIFGRVCTLFSPSSACFTAQDIVGCDDARLRAAGLSQNKLLALRDLANKTLAGEVPDIEQLQDMDDEAIIKQLTKVRGIGRWTVEMLLIFRLGRTDVLPVDDYGVRTGFMRAYGKRKLPTPKQLASYGQRWAPYRTVAAWYLWRAADQAKKTG